MFVHVSMDTEAPKKTHTLMLHTKLDFDTPKFEINFELRGFKIPRHTVKYADTY